MMVQKDYWKMSEVELTKLAEKYNIPPLSTRSGDPWAETYFNRDRVINTLLARDNAMRTRLTTFVSIIALALSLASLWVSYTSLKVKARENVQPIPTVQPTASVQQ